MRGAVCERVERICGWMWTSQWRTRGSSANFFLLSNPFFLHMPGPPGLCVFIFLFRPCLFFFPDAQLTEHVSKKPLIRCALSESWTQRTNHTRHPSPTIHDRLRWASDFQGAESNTENERPHSKAERLQIFLLFVFLGGVATEKFTGAETR